MEREQQQSAHSTTNHPLLALGVRVVLCQERIKTQSMTEIISRLGRILANFDSPPSSCDGDVVRLNCNFSGGVSFGDN